MKLRIPILTASLLGVASAVTTSNIKRHTNTPQHHVVNQFANPTWVENIVVRPNGHLLVTLLTSPEIYSLDPHSHNNTSPVLIHSFAAEGEGGVLGITETASDQYYAIVGNLSLLTGNFGFNSFGIWSIDLTKGGEAVVELVTQMPNAILPNGLSTLDKERGLLVAADSFGGCLFLIDTKAKSYEKFLAEKEMAGPDAATIGVNGLRVVPPPYTTKSTSRGIATVFFSNTGYQMLYSMEVSLDTLERVGEVELVAKAKIDDFTVAIKHEGKADTVYAAGNEVNSLLKIDLQGGRKGEVQVLLGGLNETVLAGPSSVAIGKSGKEVFVTTNGGLGGPIDGTFVEGGEVVGIRL